MKKRRIFNYPIDKDNPLYVVCEIRNQDKFYAVSQKDFLSAIKKSDEPIECLLFDVKENEQEIVFNIKEPRESIKIDRGYLDGIFLQ